MVENDSNLQENLENHAIISETANHQAKTSMLMIFPESSYKCFKGTKFMHMIEVLRQRS